MLYYYVLYSTEKLRKREEQSRHVTIIVIIGWLGSTAVGVSSVRIAVYDTCPIVLHQCQVKKILIFICMCMYTLYRSSSLYIYRGPED